MALPLFLPLFLFLQEIPAPELVGINSDTSLVNLIVYAVLFVLGGAGVKIYDRWMDSKDKEAERTAAREKSYIDLEERIYEKLEKRFRQRIASLTQDVETFKKLAQDLEASLSEVSRDNERLRETVNALVEENKQLKSLHPQAAKPSKDPENETNEGSVPEFVAAGPA